MVFILIIAQFIVLFLHAEISPNQVPPRLPPGLKLINVKKQKVSQDNDNSHMYKKANITVLYFMKFSYESS